MSVTRYEVNGSSSVFENDNGSLVDYEDYAELEARCAALAAENAGLKESRKNLAEFIHEELDADYPLNMDVETPATDAFLAEVRAQGVEMAISQAFKDGIPVNRMQFISRMTEFAAQLRKGVQS